MKFPPQHGAWAFLIVPTVMALFLGAGNWFGWVFMVTWIGAYPFTYFAGRALVARLQRGSWTNRARRELHYAGPWSFVALTGSGILIATRPWILISGAIILSIWALSTYLSWAGRERGFANDILLISLASMAPVLMYQVANDARAWSGVPHEIWVASLLSLLFFVGSVLHVKALIRESKNRRWHWGSVGFHMLALLALHLSSENHWLTLPFTLALVRTLLIKPGMKPGRIGIVEAFVASVLMVSVVLIQA